MKSVLGRLSIPAGLLACFVAAVTACGDDDVQVTPTPTPEGGTPIDSGGGTDTGTGTDTGLPPTDSGTDAPVTITPKTITLSATGHDRFFGITYDAAGN